MMEVKSDPVKSIGTGKIRSMNQGKWEMVKQEMARMNINILGISENRLDWVNLIQMTILFTLEEME